MRSGKITSKHDALIELLINDKRYKILPDGRIFSLVNKKVTKLVGRVHDKTNKATNAKFYHKVKYKGKELSTHRVIYRKFIGPLREDLVINHIDGDSLNNHYLNLEQISQGDNMKHRHETHEGVKHG